MRRRHIGSMLFLVVLCSLCLAAADSAAETVKLKGSGASFPFPLYGRWFKEYGKVNKQVQVDYQAKGSGAGMKDFVNKTVDCTASDAAMRDEQTAAVGRGVQLLPVVAGSLVLAYNLDGLGGDLKLTRDVYVDIFLGKVTTWDDPRIAAINAGLRLPTTNIALVVRQDSSGTTYAFTNHLSAISETWRDQGPGVGVAIAWPSHPIVAHGNEGVAERIKVSQGAIGYVEYGIAQRAGLSMAWLENRAGQFVQPHGGSGLATLLNVTMPENLRAFFPDPEGQDSYPIVTYSWLLLYKEYDDQLKAAALKQYVKWCLTEGQTFNETLGYVRLAPQVIARTMAALDNIR